MDILVGECYVCYHGSMAISVPDHIRFQTEVIRMALEEGMSNAQIAEKVGVSSGTIATWLKRPEYKEAINRYNELLQEETFRLSVANKSRRIQDYQNIRDRIQTVIDGRAEAYSHIPGGKSGLLVKQVKSIGSGINAYEASEYVYDTSLVRDILAISKQAAIEKGEWSEKSTLDVNVNEQVKVIRFVEQEERKELSDGNTFEADFSVQEQ